MFGMAAPVGLEREEVWERGQKGGRGKGRAGSLVGKSSGCLPKGINLFSGHSQKVSEHGHTWSGFSFYSLLWWR